MAYMPIVPRTVRTLRTILNASMHDPDIVWPPTVDALSILTHNYQQERADILAVLPDKTATLAMFGAALQRLVMWRNAIDAGDDGIDHSMAFDRTFNLFVSMIGYVDHDDEDDSDGG